MKEYEPTYLTDKEFDEVEYKNTTLSEGTIGVLMFDKYLLDNGWEAKGIRNAYHPDAVFFNRETKQYIWFGFGVRPHGKEKILFYIHNCGEFFYVPSTEEDIEMFEKGYLKPIL